MIKEITRDDVLKAFDKIDLNPELKKGRESYEYDLVFNTKKYPPILVLSEANKIAGGNALTIDDFGNSIKIAFKKLADLGFTILNKDDGFYQELKKFIDQTEKNDLRTKQYKKEYHDLRVEVSFGAGNLARIPWIAFLKQDQTVQDGIYPVYLYYKSKKLLILSYGVSETNIPNKNWNLPDGYTIDEFFKKNNLGKPERYGSSFVFKTYDTTKPLLEIEINNDLNEIIHTYKQIDSTNYNPRINTDTHTTTENGQSLSIKGNFNYQSFIESLYESNLFFNEALSLRLICSLLTKPFVILTGLSGSGKTKLAQAFAMWMCESESQYCIVAIGADWTNREPLLGFPNALEKDSYIKPDNKVLDLIIEASKSENKNKPFFLILDEMNLSHVERYFADFLSVMESENEISLHAGNNDWNGVPPKVILPKNLFIIGTVNIDETTYMFSPKVLDRANVIEFRITEKEMNSYLEGYSPVKMHNIMGAGTDMAESFIELAVNKKLGIKETLDLRKELIRFFNELKKTGAEFGYRSASEILRFTAVANELEPSWSLTDIIDAAIMQKLLPKVHGSKRKIESVLKTLARICLIEEKEIENYINKKNETFLEDPKVKFPISLEKLVRMYDNLMSNGFTSYAEA